MNQRQATKSVAKSLTSSQKFAETHSRSGDWIMKLEENRKPMVG